MKKLLLLLFVLPLIFVSCGSDDDNSLSLKEAEKTLKYGNTYQINASSDNKITYTSENEYHATVSESGLITAGRIGETNILLTDGNDTKEFKVTVNPESNLYPEPNVEFGISKSDLIKKLGTPDYQTSEGIRYDNYSSNAPQVAYLFDSSDKLETSVTMVKTAYSSELGTFLGERYVYGTSIEEDYTLIFINNLKLENATMMIGASLYNTSYWMTIYTTYTHQKSSSAKQATMLQSINELMK
ncbi:Ig-like domain-containing protein [Dysgonomonas sp. ZJ709]|uniref:Ig-like domain-containing protein n=1 Tax=Dysgonomonas sp. ZJ709 TaxID=2709797 RepID=UPI0013EB7079|nr:Ig-like domain-containing protein [Dysgonomonas sp. ZJ709]